jgi:hypothetical protein
LTFTCEADALIRSGRLNGLCEDMFLQAMELALQVVWPAGV